MTNKTKSSKVVMDIWGRIYVYRLFVQYTKLRILGCTQINPKANKLAANYQDFWRNDDK